MSTDRTQRRSYILTWLGLLALTALTTAVAFVNLGPFSTAVALAIAGLKAGLILMFFMHLMRDTVLAKVIAIGAVIWLLILMFLTATDYATRGWLPVPGR